MGRPTKTLVDRVRDRSFVPSRHAGLLAGDDSLDRLELDEGSPRLDYWGRLFELVLCYRHEARTDGERRECALAFRDAVRGDYRRYCNVMSDRDGVPLRWRADGEDGWRLEPWPDDPGYRFRRELWEGLVGLAEGGASAARQLGFVRETARRHGVRFERAAEHVARALSAP